MTLDPAHFRERYGASPDPFDLIVFSEILYYFDDADLERLLRLGIGALRPAGYRDPDFAAEVYTHSGGDLRSVAQADGIA